MNFMAASRALLVIDSYSGGATSVGAAGCVLPRRTPSKWLADGLELRNPLVVGHVEGNVTRDWFATRPGRLYPSLVAAGSGPSFDRAAHLANWGRWREARKECEAILAEIPGDPRASVLHTYARAFTKRMAPEEAQRRVQVLALEHPDVLEARLVDAALASQLGQAQIAIPMLLDLVKRSPRNRSLRATIGALLGQRGDVPAAWDQYREALLLGPIEGPCHRASAYRAAQRVRAGKDARRSALAGAGRIERAIQPPAARGFFMFSAWAGPMLLGVLLHFWPLLAVGSVLAPIIAVIGFYLCTAAFCTFWVPLVTIAGWAAYPIFERTSAETVLPPLVLFALIIAAPAVRARARARRLRGRVIRGLVPWPAGRTPPSFAAMGHDRDQRDIDTAPLGVKRRTLIGALALLPLAVAAGVGAWPEGPPVIPASWPVFQAPDSAWSIRYPPGWQAHVLPDDPSCPVAGGVVVASPGSQSAGRSGGCPVLVGGTAPAGSREVIVEIRNVDLVAGAAFAFGVSGGPPPITRLPARLDDALGYVKKGTFGGFIELKTHGHYYEVDVLLGPKAGQAERSTADLIIASLFIPAISGHARRRA